MPDFHRSCILEGWGRLEKPRSHDGITRGGFADGCCGGGGGGGCGAPVSLSGFLVVVVAECAVVVVVLPVGKEVNAPEGDGGYDPGQSGEGIHLSM